MKIYIAGQIAGLVYEEAVRMFAEAALEVERCGHEPINPIVVGIQERGRSWADYMKADIPHLLACDAIYLLPNWKDSKGARLEKHIAEELGMLIVTHGFEGRPGTLARTEGYTPKYCGRCGRKLTDGERDLGVDECYRCHNGVSHVSGVGILSAARV